MSSSSGLKVVEGGGPFIGIVIVPILSIAAGAVLYVLYRRLLAAVVPNQAMGTGPHAPPTVQPAGAPTFSAWSV